MLLFSNFGIINICVPLRSISTMLKHTCCKRYSTIWLRAMGFVSLLYNPILHLRGRIGSICVNILLAVSLYEDNYPSDGLINWVPRALVRVSWTVRYY